MNLRRAVTTRIPPLARRDEELRRRNREIRALQQRIGAVEEALAAETERADARVDPVEFASRASFTQHLVTLRRVSVGLRELDPQRVHPLRQLPFKLRNYQLAASHGIPVPRVLGVWDDVAAIDLAALPESFVLKSDGGAGSHGVLPLRRVGDEVFETLDGEARRRPEEVREHFAARAEQGRVSGPFFAEEALAQPGGGPIPDDIKVYVTYGEVQQVLLRRVGRHGDLRSNTSRYVRADGSDLGAVLQGKEPDGRIPVPESLPQMVQIAQHLSRAVGLPFVRVDLFDTDRGVVLGEITRTPGGSQRYRPDHDELMGQGWERAASRLELDLAARRPTGILYGEHPAPSLYPDGHVSRGGQPESTTWTPRVVPCAHWCRPG